MSTDKRSAAVEWAKRGFKVFPLIPNKKVPLWPRWQDKATDDPDEVERTWGDNDYNIGVHAAGLLVIDYDAKKGEEAFDALAALDLPMNTLTVATPTGGRHFYFTAADTALSAGRLGFGIDTRSANGYVIAPGSEIDGRAYTLARDEPMLEAPAGIVARLSAPREKDASAPVVDLDTPDAVLRAIRYLETDAPVAVEGENGDDLTYRVACVLKDFGLSSETALQLLLDRWNDRCAPAWEPDELRRKVDNAYGYGKLAPGAASPVADFEGVDVSALDDAPTPDAGPLEWLHWHGEGIDTSQPWLFYRRLHRTGVAVFVGPSNCGKTFLVLDMAKRLAQGDPWFGGECDAPGGTAFVFFGSEGSGFRERVAALGVDDALPIVGMRHATPLDKANSFARLLAKLQQASDQMQARFGLPLRMIVIETLSASGLLEDEQSNSQAGLAIAKLANVSLRFNAPVVFTHHPPKTGAGSRGAGALTANSDYHFEVFRKDQEQIRRVECIKGRNTETGPLGSFTLQTVRLGEDDKRRPITSCRVTTGGVVSPERAAVADDVYLLFTERLDAAPVSDVKGEKLIARVDLLPLFAAGYCATHPNASDDAVGKALDRCIDYGELTGAVAVTKKSGRVYLARAIILPEN